MSCKNCKDSNNEWTAQELINVCDELSEKYFQKYYSETGYDSQKFGFIAFVYENTSTMESISFGDVVLWCSENDEREYCEDCEVGNWTESVGEFVERQYIEYIEMLSQSLENAKLDEFYGDLRKEGEKLSCQYQLDIGGTTRSTCPCCRSTNYKDNYCEDCKAFVGVE